MAKQSPVHLLGAKISVRDNQGLATDLATDRAPGLVEKSLRQLRMDYVICCSCTGQRPLECPLGETLAMFRKMQERWLARNIGVSNFPASLLKEALDSHGAKLLVNQVEYHPFLNQQPMIDLLASRNMLMVAYMPRQGALRKKTRPLSRSHGSAENPPSR